MIRDWNLGRAMLLSLDAKVERTEILVALLYLLWTITQLRETRELVLWVFIVCYVLVFTEYHSPED